MAEPARAHDSDQDTGADPARTSRTGTPRWVKVSGIVAAVVILLLAMVFLFGGGEHGPSRHSAPASVIEYAAQPGYGVHLA